MIRPRSLRRFVSLARVRAALALVAILFLLLGAAQPSHIALAGGTTQISSSGSQVYLSSSYPAQAQSFRVYAGRLTSFTFNLNVKDGTPPDLTWTILEDNGGYPTGTALATGTVTPLISTNTTVTLGGAGPLLAADTNYWLKLSLSTTAGNGYRWLSSAVSVYDFGMAAQYDGASWSQWSGRDLNSSFTTTDDTPTPSITYTPSDTPTGTLTPSMTYTPSITPTNTLVATWTPTPTPNLYVITTLTTGQEVAVKYEITAGDAMMGALTVILLALVAFILFMQLLRRRQA